MAQLWNDHWFEARTLLCLSPPPAFCSHDCQYRQLPLVSKLRLANSTQWQIAQSVWGCQEAFSVSSYSLKEAPLAMRALHRTSICSHMGVLKCMCEKRLKLTSDHSQFAQSIHPSRHAPWKKMFCPGFWLYLITLVCDHELLCWNWACSISKNTLGSTQVVRWEPGLFMCSQALKTKDVEWEETMTVLLMQFSTWFTILHAHTSFSAYSTYHYWQCALPIKLHVNQSSQRKSESTWSHVLHVYLMYTCPQRDMTPTCWMPELAKQKPKFQ